MWGARPSLLEAWNSPNEGADGNRGLWAFAECIRDTAVNEQELIRVNYQHKTVCTPAASSLSQCQSTSLRTTYTANPDRLHA